jgi:hypothetical protein
VAVSTPDEAVRCNNWRLAPPVRNRQRSPRRHVLIIRQFQGARQTTPPTKEPSACDVGEYLRNSENNIVAGKFSSIAHRGQQHHLDIGSNAASLVKPPSVAKPRRRAISRWKPFRVRSWVLRTAQNTCSYCFLRHLLDISSFSTAAFHERNICKVLSTFISTPISTPNTTPLRSST